MKKIFGVFVMAAIAAAPIVARAADAAGTQKLDQRLQAAPTSLGQFMSTNNKAIPNKIANNAYCAAVVSGLIKRAFNAGAEDGQGVAA